MKKDRMWYRQCCPTFGASCCDTMYDPFCYIKVCRKSCRWKDIEIPKYAGWQRMLQT